MSATSLQNRAKYISHLYGKPTEVIILYKVFQEFLEMKMSMEIYEREEVQEGLKRSKEEVRKGKARSFTDIDEAIEWLKK
ncbi:MAG: hypothetical protein KGZ58_05735 [Ignavibacteriales bacterium]|nr:hypothetical protein [Ignavibacteriales bacterium]